jgi:hypothetical protein
VPDPSANFRINLNQNLWGLVVGLAALGIGERCKICKLTLFGIFISSLMSLSLPATTIRLYYQLLPREVLRMTILCLYISPFAAVSIIASMIFVGIWIVFWWPYRKTPSRPFHFDPQDAWEENRAKPSGRSYPLSAKSATFLPFLEHYIGVTKLMVTVAAASIAFGGDKGQQTPILIVIAKLSLAWSILFGVCFCLVLLWRYDEYGQDSKSYTTWWYSIVFASCASSFVCFIAGYLVWGWGLSR